MLDNLLTDLIFILQQCHAVSCLRVNATQFLRILVYYKKVKSKIIQPILSPPSEHNLWHIKTICFMPKLYKSIDSTRRNNDK